MAKSIQWPADHGRLKRYLDPTDKIYYRKITNNGVPESVGTGSAGKACTMIIGIKKDIEGLQKISEFRGREEFTGLSIEIGKDDMMFSCEVDSRGYPASLGLPNSGKDITIIVHGG